MTVLPAFVDKLTTFGFGRRKTIKAEVLNNSVSGSHLLEITQVQTRKFGAKLSSWMQVGVCKWWQIKAVCTTGVFPAVSGGSGLNLFLSICIFFSQKMWLVSNSSDNVAFVTPQTGPTDTHQPCRLFIFQNVSKPSNSISVLVCRNDWKPIPVFSTGGCNSGVLL